MTSPVIVIFLKDVRSELRTRYALNALMMFVLTTLSIILFSIGNENVSPEVLSGVLWIIIFFSSMSGLSRTFVSEEERGTVMTLQMLAKPHGAIQRGPLFVTGEQHRDRARMLRMGHDKFFDGHHHRRERGFHVGRTTAV